MLLQIYHLPYICFMYFVSVTRLRLKSLIYFPGMVRANSAVSKQLVVTPGFVAGKELIDKGLIFWTITVWQGDADMKVFRNSEAHRKAMQKLPDWCNEATYAHWLQETDQLPNWEAVHHKIISEGSVSKVRHPSADHATKNFLPPIWKKTQQVFKKV